MTFDRATPVAVFLGPSLGLEDARAILPANYYPPVAHGDVYRLMTCGVRLIVIIDGVFHGSVPVWQREILAALENGITVVGASSMGALRAAELAPFGMIGRGTVYEWYRDGRIDGDDEVALLHTDASLGYRPLSVPLVTVRQALARACASGAVRAAEAEAALADLAARDFGSRTWDIAYAHAPGLEPFLAANPVDVKADDARDVLAWCAASLAALPPLPRPSERRRIDRTHELPARGIVTPSGELRPLSEWIARAGFDSATLQDIQRQITRRYFLLAALRSNGRAATPDAVDAWASTWEALHAPHGRAEFLRAVAMTADELERELRDRATCASVDAADGDELIAAWIDEQGIDVPEAHTSSAASRTAWIVAAGPAAVGDQTWSPDIAVTRELQMSRRIGAPCEPAGAV